MSLLCRSSWILPFSKGSTSLTTEGTYNQSFVPLGSIGPSVGVSFVFLPSFLPSFIHAFTLLGTKMSLFCRSSWIPPFSKVSTSLTKEGRSTNHPINHSLWARLVSQSVVCSSSYHPSFLHSFNWESIYACFAGAVEFFLLVGVQLLLQRKAH